MSTLRRRILSDERRKRRRIFNERDPQDDGASGSMPSAGEDGPTGPGPGGGGGDGGGGGGDGGGGGGFPSGGGSASSTLSGGESGVPTGPPPPTTSMPTPTVVTGPGGVSTIEGGTTIEGGSTTLYGSTTIVSTTTVVGSTTVMGSTTFMGSTTIVGSGPGSVTGVPSSSNSSGHHLSGATIAAILIGSALALTLLIFALRQLWQRRRSAPVASAGGLRRPPMSSAYYSDMSYGGEPLAARLRGGLIDPYSGAASTDTLPSFYRIEPFRTAGAGATGAAAVAGGSAPRRNEKTAREPSASAQAAALRFAPRPGPLRFNPPVMTGWNSARYHGLGDVGTPSDGESVLEFPPTYASLRPDGPRPINRRWYQFW